MTDMTEDEDTTSHGDDAILISSDESEAESSEAELGRSNTYLECVIASLTRLSNPLRPP
jgi:hypothetical protein